MAKNCVLTVRKVETICECLGSATRCEDLAYTSTVSFMLNIGFLFATSLIYFYVDMIGFKEKEPVLFLETQPRFSTLAQLFVSVASALHISMSPMICLNAWGSDHIPCVLYFINCNINYKRFTK